MYAACEELAYVPSSTSTTSRLEAFSDGVIAVIITIMVLELKVPHENGIAGLRAILPILLIYALSFTFIAIYWINHHQLVGRIEEVDGRILYSNLLFLFCLSLLPFFTSWVIEKEIDPFSVVLYGISFLVTGTGFLLLRLSILRRLRLRQAVCRSDVAAQTKHFISLALYAILIPIAWFHPVLSLVATAIVTILWILPGLGTRVHDENDSSASQTSKPVRGDHA